MLEAPVVCLIRLCCCCCFFINIFHWCVEKWTRARERLIELHLLIAWACIKSREHTDGPWLYVISCVWWRVQWDSWFGWWLLLLSSHWITHSSDAFRFLSHSMRWKFRFSIYPYQYIGGVGDVRPLLCVISDQRFNICARNKWRHNMHACRYFRCGTYSIHKNIEILVSHDATTEWYIWKRVKKKEYRKANWKRYKCVSHYLIHSMRSLFSSIHIQHIHAIVAI